MEITLYNFSKRVNSLKVPTGGTGLSVHLKEETGKYNPTFILNVNPMNYNYIKWNDRYYYIENARYIHNNIFEIDCSIDVLASYRTQILNTNAFVQYSSSNYNSSIVDGRLSTKDVANYKINSSTLLTDGSTGRTGGTYIVSYVTSMPTLGISGCLWLGTSSAMNLANVLSSDGFNDFLTDFDKQFQGAYDSLLSCKYVPFSWYADGISQHPANIVLGGYDSGVTGMVPAKYVTYSCDVNIPWQYNDFRNLQPFTSLLLYLPAYGYYEINPNDLIGQTSLHIYLNIDGITGEGTYIIGNIGKCTCMFSNDISIGTVHGNAMGLVSGIISTAISVASENPVGTVSSIEGIISSQKRSLGNTGNLSGGSSVLASIGDWTSVHLVSITHDTNVSPSNIATQQGRPLLEVVSLSSLTGYCQTINASVNANASVSILEQINNYLNGGVYIE